ncbi:DNA mismatch repair protein MutS, partial [Pseudomonas fluorescens]
MPEFTVGQSAPVSKLPNDLRPAIADELNQAPLRMDKKSFGKMKRGKLVPEDRIDLHGMTLDRAHPALNSFILGSFSRGLRLVLVITGKGKSKEDFGPIPVRRGVLKHN